MLTIDHADKTAVDGRAGGVGAFVCAPFDALGGIGILGCICGFDRRGGGRLLWCRGIIRQTRARWAALLVQDVPVFTENVAQEATLTSALLAEETLGTM